MTGKTRLYILTGNKKPISWQLRSRALVFREGKGLREIIYIEGGHSIWKDDYEKDALTQSKEIWFEDGCLLVNPSNLLLIEYLEAHPEFNKSFKLDNPEADAVKELEALEREELVKDELSKLEDYGALVEALRRKDEVTIHLTPSQKKLRCYKEAKQDPDKVLKAIKDPKTITKYMVALALSRNIISLNTPKTHVVWGDNKEVICAIPTGQKVVDIMSNFLFEPKNEGTLEELQRRIDELEGTATKTADNTSASKKAKNTRKSA